MDWIESKIFRVFIYLLIKRNNLFFIGSYVDSIKYGIWEVRLN